MFEINVVICTTCERIYPSRFGNYCPYCVHNTTCAVCGTTYKQTIGAQCPSCYHTRLHPEHYDPILTKQKILQCLDWHIVGYQTMNAAAESAHTYLDNNWKGTALDILENSNFLPKSKIACIFPTRSVSDKVMYSFCTEVIEEFIVHGNYAQHSHDTLAKIKQWIKDGLPKNQDIHAVCRSQKNAGILREFGDTDPVFFICWCNWTFTSPMESDSSKVQTQRIKRLIELVKE